MNVTQLLKHYNVSFFKRKDEYGTLNYVCEGGWFAWHLDELQDEEDIEQILLYIAYLLNGGTHDYLKDRMSTNVTYATLYGDSVEIMGALGAGSNRTEIITLVDFKLILEEWLKFLKT